MRKAILLFVICLSVFTTAYSQDTSRAKMEIDSLETLASDFYSQGNYAEAIRLGTEAMEITERVLGKEHPYYAATLTYLAGYNSALGNYDDAIKLCTEALEIYEKTLGKEHPYYATVLSSLANYNADLGNYDEAIRLETEALEIVERVLGKEDPAYATSLSNLASYNAYLGNYDEAIRLCTEALEITEIVEGKETSNYAISLNNLAKYQSKLGNYDEAIRLETEALEIYEKTLGKEHPYYATVLSSLANYNADLGNYDEAIRLETEALEIVERVLGKEDPAYATSLSNLASYNAYLGNYDEAIRLCTEALEITEIVEGKETSNYAISLNNLAGVYSKLGNYAEAIRLGTEALEITERVLGKEHPNYTKFLRNLAEHYSYWDNYDEAIRLYTENMEIMEMVLGKDLPTYADFLRTLGSYNFYGGYYVEAIRLETEAIEITEKVEGKERPNYAVSLNNLANYNFALGNYVEAIRLATEALEIRERTIGKASSGYARSLNNMASYNSILGNYDEAIRLGTEALEIREILGKEDSEYPKFLSNLANFNFYKGNYAEAIRLVTEALEITEKIFGKEHPDYAATLSYLANFNFYKGNYDEAIRLETEALAILEKTLGKENPLYAASLSVLANFNFWSDYDKEASKYAIECTQLSSKIVRSTFSRLTSNERRMFWDKYNYWFEDYLPFLASCIRDDSLTTTAYDGALMSKGLLLNSEIEMSKLLLESGDEAAISKYNELKSNRMQLNRLYETPIAERHINTDSLERVIDRQEKELVQLSQTYGDYMKNLDINWRQVRDKLGDNDIAIEFLDFVVPNDSINVYTIMYAALTLAKNDSVPHMIPLFVKSELDSITKKDDYYKTQKLSQLVWQPLSEDLEGKKNIYFAPTGELHSIAIESIPCYEGEGIMSDHWTLYRLSSTRELAKIKDKNEWKDAYIYGDLKYGTNVDVLIADNKKYGNTRGAVDWEVANFVKSLSTRGAIPLLNDLGNTKKEVIDVDSLLRVLNVNATLLTDTLGTEASFKALDGQKPNVLHIATHGFYWPEKDTVHITNPRQKAIMGNNAGAKYVEDQALTRAYLCFTGAQNTLNGDPPPENVEDGLLTAKEISELDLRGLDLVVLSACETGLGDITGDGVFGLQRGFFKAGANTLIMSLWGVDDKATQMLMTQFYTNLTNGMTKYEAFRAAQKYLREYEENGSPKYADPYYWAAFIIVDAIN